MNSDRIEDQLLSSVANFTIPQAKGDFSNFSSSMNSLQVHLEEIKNEHKSDLSGGPAERLVKILTIILCLLLFWMSIEMF